MVYPRVIFREILIIFRYSIFPTFTSLLLSLLGWKHGLIMAMVKMLIFLRVIHNEDQRTAKLRLRFIFVKLATAIFIYVGVAYLTSYMEETFYLSSNNFYSGGEFPVTTIGKRVRMSRKKAKSLMRDQRSAGATAQTLQHIAVQIAIEYLAVSSSIAAYRITFLGLLYTFIVVLHFVIWAFVPSNSKSRGASENENYGNEIGRGAASSHQNDLDMEDDDENDEGVEYADVE